MKTVTDTLEERISAAMAEVAGQKAPAIVRPATDAKFGDYQVNGVMALAKQIKTNPRKLAEQIVAELDISDICEEPEIAGPGFINLRLKPGFVAANLLQINKGADRLGIEKADKSETIVVDFSGPNIAKQMHVGHLRSTIIGDCICRLLEFEGHTVIRQNHIGDWGLQMGMVVGVVAYSLFNYVFEKLPKEEFAEFDWGKKLGTIPLEDWEKLYRQMPKANWDDLVRVDLNILEQHYKSISDHAKEDLKVAEHVRYFTVELQSAKNEFINYLWQKARELTLKECFDIYDLLGGIFKPKDICGESFYKDMLPDVVVELKKKNLAVESDGAVCVFPEGFKNKEGEPLPVIAQKSDGAYLYATTDLAAIRYRVDKLKADRIIYVTDARQKLHFEMVFATAKMAGWDVKQKINGSTAILAVPARAGSPCHDWQKTELVHITFGSVLGENGKPLKTREGENVKLKDLLDEAVERAKTIVKEKNPDLKPDKKERIANAVGIGAVKYADYSNNRTSDYIFSFNKMLAMDGNTAPYMQYAYARIKSIERKAQSRDMDIETELAGVKTLSLSEPDELDLAKHLIRYGEAIEAAAADYRPNYLTAYLYELAQKFSAFYTNCPVLDAGPDKRPTRLLLCDLTAKTIRHGLSELLGIEVVEQM